MIISKNSEKLLKSLNSKRKEYEKENKSPQLLVLAVSKNLL